MKIIHASSIIGCVLLTGCIVSNSKLKQQILLHVRATSSEPNNTKMSLQAAEVIADNIVFPKDGGVINVKNAPYRAKGDGVTDDTAAIQKALSAYPNQNKIIYLPNGTYLVSNQLQWPAGRSGNTYKRTILQGQNRARTIIKLKHDAPGFTNSAKPKAVIWTGPAPAQRFRNAIRNLTVDTGSGNAGAIGIQFMANNQGVIRHVTIQSGDNLGVIGLDLRHVNEVGPCLIKNVKVIGFRRGIYTGYTVNSQTFEHITLQNQKEYGIYNGGQVINIRDLTSNNSVQTVYNADGVVTLIDANLSGFDRATTQPVIKNDSTLFARNIRTTGYKMAIQNNSGNRQNATEKAVSEFVSHPIHSLFPSRLKSLNLSIDETPEVPWGDLREWVSPTAYGAVPNDNKDDSTAIQAAIDSGKQTVYFPNGAYKVSQNIYIRNNVRRIIGLEAKIAGKGHFRFDNGNAPVVIVERFDGFGSGIEHNASRTLVLSSMGLAISGGRASYSNTAKGTGSLYIEDVVGAPWTFNKQKVWARQINAENDNATHITNNGGTLWILGLKTERGGILVDTKGGGKTEILGGFVYSTSGVKTTPMFTNHNSSVSLTIAECNYNGNPFKNLVSETRASGKKISLELIRYSGATVV